MEITLPPKKQKSNKWEDLESQLTNLWTYVEYLAKELQQATGGKWECRFLEMVEQSTEPDTPSSNRARVYLKDNGAGKNQLILKCDTGNTIQIAVDT